jgi:hypothetical protein
VSVLAAGSQLKIEGMFAADRAASDDWKSRWDEAIGYLARRGAPFTADDVREIAGDPTDHPNATGARFLAAARAGLIRRVGYRKATHEGAHARMVSEWVGQAQAAAARPGVAFGGRNLLEVSGA